MFKFISKLFKKEPKKKEWGERKNIGQAHFTFLSEDMDMAETPKPVKKIKARKTKPVKSDRVYRKLSRFNVARLCAGYQVSVLVDKKYICLQLKKEF